MNDSWSYECHVPNNYVKKLGQFVQAGIAQEFASPGNPWIVLHFIFFWYSRINSGRCSR